MEARARFLPHARRAKHTPLCCTCLVGWGMETLGQGVRATGQDPAFACRDFGLCMSSPQTYECERTCLCLLQCGKGIKVFICRHAAAQMLPIVAAIRACSCKPKRLC